MFSNLSKMGGILSGNGPSLKDLTGGGLLGMTGLGLGINRGLLGRGISSMPIGGGLGMLGSLLGQQGGGVYPGMGLSMLGNLFGGNRNNAGS